MHRSRFPPFWEVLGGIWGRPCELLRASWPPRRPRCPQEPQRRLPEASQTPPEASQRHPRDVQEAENCLKIYLFCCFGDFPCNLVVILLCFNSGPGGMRESIKLKERQTHTHTIPMHTHMARIHTLKHAQACARTRAVADHSHLLGRAMLHARNE